MDVSQNGGQPIARFGMIVGLSHCDFAKRNCRMSRSIIATTAVSWRSQRKVRKAREEGAEVRRRLGEAASRPEESNDKQNTEEHINAAEYQVGRLHAPLRD